MSVSPAVSSSSTTAASTPMPAPAPSAVTKPDLGEIQARVKRILSNAFSELRDANQGRSLQFFIPVMVLAAIIPLALKGNIVAPSVLGAAGLVGIAALNPWARREGERRAELEKQLYGIAGTNDRLLARSRLLKQEVICFVAQQALLIDEPEKCSLPLIMQSDAFKEKFKDFYRPI